MGIFRKGLWDSEKVYRRLERSIKSNYDDYVYVIKDKK